MTWKRILTAALLTLSAAFGATAWAQGTAISIDFAPVDPELQLVENDLEASTTEIYFGDAVYFRAFDRNASKATVYRPNATFAAIADFTPYVGVDYSFLFFAAAVQADGVDGTYCWTPEFPVRTSRAPATSDWTEILPGAERDYGAFAVEFPPLEDWDDPFWRAVRERLATEERVEIQARFVFARDLKKAKEPAPRKLQIAPGVFPANSATIVASTGGGKAIKKKIVLKRRPEAEMKRLDEWFASTPKVAFPERVDARNRSGYKIPRTEQIAEESRSAVEIAGKKYSPRLVVRCGNRKPSVLNNPTTLDGWRKLEAEFSPSTLRDEITLTRLQLEYYEAELGEKTDAALNALTAWLDALPGPQRAALVASITSRRWLVVGLKVGTGRTPVDFNVKEIAPKYERLCAALVPPVEPSKPEPIRPTP